MYDKEGNIIDRREQLRVKVKSLAAESRIIRVEELRLKKRAAKARSAATPRGVGDDIRADLREHRVHVVRKHARNAHLALGFIRGRTIKEMENKVRRRGVGYNEPDWEEDKRLCKKYGPPVWHWTADRLCRSRSGQSCG